MKDGSMTYPIKSCESNCLFAVSSIIRKIRKITLATICGSPRRGGLRFENLVLRVAEGESPYRVRAFPDSLYADRIGHGRSIEFAPVNRQLTSLLHTRSHFRISNPAAVHFRSIRSGNENTYGDVWSTVSKYSLRAWQLSEWPRTHARCQVDMPLSRLGHPRQCIVGSRCQVRN